MWNKNNKAREKGSLRKAESCSSGIDKGGGV